ncbi:MAG TPA: hypothetical protein VMZ22_01440 [Acidimicrobiales bacterium]|nr:hypothetical protein [Acidimicrobiales bacterium]
MSCQSASDCVAVGQYSDNVNQLHPWVSRWDGSNWTTDAFLSPVGTTGAFFGGVSCFSSSSCVAVGSYYQSDVPERPFAERWNGTSWVLETMPVPLDADLGFMRGVSCPSASSCFAVGNIIRTDGTYMALTEQWNGVGWSVQPNSVPTSTDFALLVGASCTSESACTAVGSRREPSNDTTRAVVQRWNGTSWVAQVTPQPAGTPNDKFSDVACVTATSCVAVGSLSGSNVTVALAERWNGSVWKTQATPNPNGRSERFFGVSCVTGDACMAVGQFKNISGRQVALAERWNGSKWLPQTVSMPQSSSSLLAGVSCTAASECTAVGHYVDNAGVRTLTAHRWEGTVWSRQDVPVPAGASSSQLTGVDCVSVSICVASGHFTDSSGHQLPLIRRWKDGVWRSQTVAGAAGATATLLSAVSCSSGTSCTAVGSFLNAGVRSGFATRWDGATWSAQPVPRPTPAVTASLLAVSCASATSCVAVGHSATNSEGRDALIEGWDGSAWVVQAAPVPAGTVLSALAGVSCVSATACSATGYYFDGAGVQRPFADRFDTSTWVVQSAPPPAGATASQFAAVSCVSAILCSGVGESTASPTVTIALAERYE